MENINMGASRGLKIKIRFVDISQWEDLPCVPHANEYAFPPMFKGKHGTKSLSIKRENAWVRGKKHFQQHIGRKMSTLRQT